MTKPTPPSELMPDGMIAPGSDIGRVFSFTTDRFDPSSYLWKIGDAIMVSFIMSKARGNFRELVHRIHALGFTVKVPTPLARMEQIVRKNGYQRTVEHDDEMGEDVEVWVLTPPKP